MSHRHKYSAPIAGTNHPVDGVPRLGNDFLKFLFGEAAQGPRLVGEVLINTAKLRWVFCQPAFLGYRILGYRIKSNSFLLRLAQLIDPPRRAHPDLNSICLELAVLGLAGVGGHCDRLVADVFHLINRLGVSDRAAGT